MIEAWDQRIARYMVRPLINTRVTPNHLTTLRLIVGLLAVSGFASGDYIWSNIAAIGFTVSNLLDHTDGELARMTGKTSTFGHYYDLASDAIIHILLFICIGLGLRHSSLGHQSINMGILAGISVWLIFFFRMKIENRKGKEAVQQPSFGKFEMEDILYLLPLVTLLDALKLFISFSAIVSPWVAIFFVWEYFNVIKTEKS